MDDSAEGKYNIIIGKDHVADSGLNLKFSDHIIEENNGTFKGLMSPMVDLGTYEFK